MEPPFTSEARALARKEAKSLNSRPARLRWERVINPFETFSWLCRGSFSFCELIRVDKLAT